MIKRIKFKYRPAKGGSTHTVYSRCEARAKRRAAYHITDPVLIMKHPVAREY